MKKYKYISRFPKPFLEDIVNNRCIPIIGAGFSKNAEMPAGKQMPDWDSLGKKIAAMLPDYQYFNTIEALSVYAHEFSRTSLIEKITELLLIDSAKPGETHKAFCELPFELIVTTNLEFLLEQGYALVNKFCRPIIEEDQLTLSNLSNINNGVALLKLHGDINHPKRLVITEEDYDRFLTIYPMLSTFLSNQLITKTPLFIGYSLDDNNFRQIHQIINDRLGNLRRQAYAISVDCSPYEIARFERRSVKVINIPGDKIDYPKILKKIFEELSDYLSNEILNYTTITKDDTLAELSLPKDINNRICFFSVPLRLLSFYKKFIFPIVEEQGFIPVTAEDVVTAGDNWTAAIFAIMSRAEFIIVDASSKNTQYELSFALSKIKNKNNILIISDNAESIPFDLSDIFFISRKRDPFMQTEELINLFESWFVQKSNSFRTAFEEEPRRLIEKKEFRAAVISAVSLLESVMKDFIPRKMDIKELRRPYSIVHLSKMLLSKDFISENDYKRIRDAIGTRNMLVHSDKSINGNKAKGIVDNIYSLISYLEECVNT